MHLKVYFGVFLNENRIGFCDFLDKKDPETNLINVKNDIREVKPPCFLP